MLGDSSEELYKLVISQQRSLVKTLIESNEEDREHAYREVYEKIQEFYLKHQRSSAMYLYEPLTERKLWEKRPICKIVGKNKAVLEVGCGDGVLSLALAEAGNDVIGIDISSRCIHICETNKQKLKVRRARFLRMNACNLNFPSDTFDCVVSRELIEHLHPKDVILHLKEVKRILREKGFYFFVTPNKYQSYFIPLHLKEYTYFELYGLLSQIGFFPLKSLLLYHNLPSNLVIPMTTKVALEKVFCFFVKKSKSLDVLWFFIGLTPICVMAFKS
jgi:2-polyprenyl-3-methyl-5-hydroxy-6-metoxy-1,4-benzoquinol methylase